MKTLLVLSQPNCNPCKLAKAHLQRIGASYHDVDVLSNPEEAGKYGVMSAPVIILLDGKEEIKRSYGFNPPELEEMATQL